MIKEYYIYMLECDNGSLYTGYTTDIDRRVREHLGGNRRAKFTAGFRPVRTAACWKLSGTRSDALKVEAFIKRMNRAGKDELVAKPELLEGMLEEITAARVSVYTASATEGK